MHRAELNTPALRRPSLCPRHHAGAVVAISERCGVLANKIDQIAAVFENFTAMWCDFEKYHLFSKPLGLKGVSRRSTNSIFRLENGGTLFQ
jgi:hypothetical protein